jgi:tetratricopeptide (TPR) repeat protein
VKLLNNLGKLEESIGSFQTALQLYTKAMQAEPSDVRGWLNCANLNTKLGNYQLAEHLYRKAIASFPTLYQPKPPKTIESSSAAFVSVTPMQLRAAINLANLMSNNPLKKDEANRLYERLVVLKPDFGATYFSWIHNLLSNNSTDRGSVQNVLIRLISNAPQLDCDLLYNVSRPSQDRRE